MPRSLLHHGGVTAATAVLLCKCPATSQGSTLYLWDKSAPLIDAAKHGHLDVVRFLVTLPRMNINARYYLVRVENGRVRVEKGTEERVWEIM